MDAREILRSGDLLGAVEQLKQEVRRAPREAKLRTFLFQLFCITGAWERALTQLAMAAELDPLAIPMAQTYQPAIRCELLRERIFAGHRAPTVFGEPAEWMSLLIEATRVLAEGRAEEAAGLRDAAFEAAPASSGTIEVSASSGAIEGSASSGAIEGSASSGAIGASANNNDAPFEWVADADQRLGPMLEAIVDGKYYWVPFARLRSLTMEAPADLRDQVWMPANFVWSNGGQSVGFIPARYPGSAEAGAALALSRSTEWREQGDWSVGVGQRMLATSGGEYALLDVRKLQITPAPGG